MRRRALGMYRIRRALIRIFIACLIFFYQCWSLGLLIKFVKNERLRWSVARTFRPPPKTDVAFWFGFVASDFPLSALEAARGSLWHRHTTCGGGGVMKLEEEGLAEISKKCSRLNLLIVNVRQEGVMSRLAQDQK